MEENLISAKIIQHSQHALVNTNLVTWEVELPRIILAEFNTHKILVRNAQSSRAIPTKAVIKNLETNFFMPSYWGKNKPGMSANDECKEFVNVYGVEIPRDQAWMYAKDVMETIASAYDDAGYHKQVQGRLLESFTMTKLVVSGTELDNLFNLRIHPAAEPHFRDLAIKMYLSLRESVPKIIRPGEWHLPYIDRDYDEYDKLIYSINGEEIDLETAKKISLSCIAQTSYRKHDDSEDKADDIINKLFNGDIVHASPAEHIGTPMKLPLGNENIWEDGVTHIDRIGDKWSGQFKHFIQYRQLIPNNVCTNFTHEKFLEYTKERII